MNYDLYKNTLPYPKITDFPSKEDHNKALSEYWAEDSRLCANFREDFFEELDVENNPKRDKLFSKCWERGHSAGYSEVMNIGYDLVSLIED